MDIDPRRLSAAISDLYAASLERTARDLLPEKLAKAFDATSCLLHTRAVSSEGVTILGATDNVKRLMPDYAKHYHSRDLWAVKAGERRFIGRAILGEELVPEGELINAEWYYDLCRPFGVHHIVGAVFDIGDQIQGQIGIHRARDSRAFEDRDRAMMDLLIPHLRQAYRLLRIVNRNARTHKLTFDVLGTLSVGVFVVQGCGRVQQMNGLAEKILADNGPIAVKNGILQLSDPKLHDQLRRNVQQASLAPLGRSHCSGGTLIIHTDRGEALLLMVIPLPQDPDASPLEPLVAVMVGNPSYRAEPSPDLIRAMYGLTAAETRVLLAIIKGQNLPEYAQEAGISINTAHSQAKNVYSKTGCHRQSDLVAKILHRPMFRIGGLFRPVKALRND